MAVGQMRAVRTPQPYGCRNPPPPPLSDFGPFDDEVSKRVGLHRLLDEAYRDFALPGDRGSTPPSRWLYTSLNARPRGDTAWQAELAAWRIRFVAARVQDAQYLWQAPLLDALGLPRLCRGSTDPAQRVLQRVMRRFMWQVGSEVHRRLGARYREANRTHEVSVDGRVYFPRRGGGAGRSEQLSRLALSEPYSVYGGLNYCLAGQRNDIIDLDTGEMWEIKPASLTSANLLQLWGYVDNYEVARVMAFYNDEPALPVMRPGNPGTLDKKILRSFEYSVTEAVSLKIVPFVNPLLPGIISYRADLRLRRRPRPRAEARAFLQRFDVDIDTVVQRSRRRQYVEEQLQLAEGRRILIYVGIALVVGSMVLTIATLQGEALPAEGAALAGLTEAAAATTALEVAGAAGAAALEGAEATAAAGRLIQLAEMTDGVRGAEMVLRGLAAAEAQGAAGAAGAAGTGLAAQQLGAMAASMETLYIAGQAFTVPAEIAGFCIEGGCAAAAACTPFLQ